ncbi:MAG: hypothetical protein ACRD2P_09335 [Terriglobia bacterium]
MPNTQFVSKEDPQSILLNADISRLGAGSYRVVLRGETHQKFPELRAVQLMDRLQSDMAKVVVPDGPPCELDGEISHSDEDVWKFDLRRPNG